MGNVDREMGNVWEIEVWANIANIGSKYCK
jgi:hypothetical protein